MPLVKFTTLAALMLSALKVPVFPILLPNVTGPMALKLSVTLLVAAFKLPLKVIPPEPVVVTVVIVAAKVVGIVPVIFNVPTVTVATLDPNESRLAVPTVKVFTGAATPILPLS